MKIEENKSPVKTIAVISNDTTADGEEKSFESNTCILSR